MKGTERREKIAAAVLVGAAFFAVAFSSDRLLVNGVLRPWFERQEFWQMAAEVLLLFVLFLGAWRFLLSPVWRIAAVSAVLAVFFWAHTILVPIVVSGLYLGYLCVAGREIRFFLKGKAAEGGSPELFRDFLMGSLAVLCVFCAMSAAGIGDIPKLLIFVAVSACAAAAAAVKKRKVLLPVCRMERPKPGRWERWETALIVSVILTSFCIQAGRMNIAVDYDSLWYGVRSKYILDNGHGIYENMGNIGIVYVYSKGFEVLTLPLSVLPSYSFLIAFNWWLTAAALSVSYKIAVYYMDRRQALLLTALLAAIPGIMNMSITAKTDTITLFVQLILIYELLRYLKGEKEAWCCSLAAFFFSWTLKPTAMVFSTAVMGMSGIYLLMTGRFPILSKGSGKPGKAAVCEVVLSLAALAAVWARTARITGLPVTSVFSSVLTKLGFQMKYPFAVQTIPNSGADVSADVWIKNMAKRFYGILLNPQGPDMNHVILAWGGPMVLVCLFLWIFCLFLKKRERTGEEKDLDRYFHVMFLPFLACCVISLMMLTQVDGNYFMLFYVLLAIYGFRLAQRAAGSCLKPGLKLAVIPLIGFGMTVTAMTNWSGTVGFTPVNWTGRGYYDHEEKLHQQMIETGNGQIWDILAENRENRLISVGEHPQSLMFPCNAQSYLDITGSGGNVVLVKYMDNFVKFMEYARTDYVYVQAGYMAEEERAFTLTKDLIEYGILVPVCYEEGNMLASVDVNGQWTETSKAYMEEFLQLYRRKNAS